MYRIKLLFVLLLVALNLNMSAQGNKYFTSESGLSSSLFNKIYQDSNDIIWIATENGLNRFDGSKIKTYKHVEGDSLSLCHNYVTSIFEDSKGRLFIGTFGGLQIYNPITDKFSSIATSPNGSPMLSHVINVVERNNGDYLVLAGGLRTLTITDNDELIVEPYNPKSLLPQLEFGVVNMLQDADDNIWLITTDAQLWKMSGSVNTSKHYQIDTDALVANIHVVPNGVYVNSLDNLVYKYNAQTDTFEKITQHSVADSYLYSFCQISSDELLIPTDGEGVKVLNIRTNQIDSYEHDAFFLDSDELKVHNILLDKYKNIWFSIYQKGIMMVPDEQSNFNYIGNRTIRTNIIGNCAVSALLCDHLGRIWVGTDNDGIYCLSADGKKQLHHYSSADDKQIPKIIMGLYEDSESRIWVGSFEQGLGYIDEATGKYKPLVLTDSFRNKFVNRVFAFAEDNQKRLWIATSGSGLFYYDLRKKEIVHPVSQNQYLSLWLNSLLISKNNVLYIATHNGLCRIDLNKEPLSVETITSSDIVYCLHEDELGNIYYGSIKGLNCFNPKIYENRLFTQADGFQPKPVYGIQSGKQNELWLSTNDGLILYNSESGLLSEYYRESGLQDNEFLKNSSIKDNKGNIWFGGINGITYFSPDYTEVHDDNWHVRLTDLYINNQSINAGSESAGHLILDQPIYQAENITLSHKDNSFVLEFSVVEPHAPRQISYAYSINDGEWITLPKGINRISLYRLAPGNYNLKYRINEKNHSSNVGEIQICILHPWWQTSTAHLIYFLLFAIAVYLVYRYLQQRSLMRKSLLEHKHKEEMNEAKLQFFMNISHEIRTPMSLITGPMQKLMSNDKDAQRQNSYKTIMMGSNRILQLINQLLDIRKIDKEMLKLSFKETEIIGYVKEVLELFEQSIIEKNIHFEFVHEGIESQNAWIDPAHFDKIINNLFSNAIKFTPIGGKIELSISREIQQGKAYLKISIADNGIGIPAGNLEQIFERFYQVQNTTKTGTGIGLHLTRSLVEMHHGTIHAENVAEGGSRFVIMLPLGKDHLRQDELVFANEKQTDSEYLTAETKEQSVVVNFMLDETKDPAAKKKRHLLIVEDDEDILLYLSNELSSDYHVHACTSPKTALEYALKNIPDLIVSDIMMPEMDGITFCKKIKQNINLIHIPIIMLTAKVSEQDQITAFEAGADAYISKPFSISLLVSNIKRLLKNREQLQNAYTGQQVQESKLKKIHVETPDERLMDRIMKVVNKNLDNPELSIELITKEVGISRAHLHRKLKELTNQNTTTFIRNIRLQQAANLLKEKRHSIVEIARIVGFSRANNFSTAFKELYGITPMEWREQHSNMEE